MSNGVNERPPVHPTEHAHTRTRDVVSLGLMGAGTAGLVCVAFLVSPLAGVAWLSVSAIVVGVALGLA